MDSVGHVVLVHAFPLTAELWRPQHGTMPQPWRLVTPDLPGFGASSSPPARTMDQMARCVLNVMDQNGIDRAVIGGMSMGGYATLALYRFAPDRFSGMVLVDTRGTADTDQQKDGRRKMIETVRSKGASAIADEMVPKLLGPTSHRERPTVVASVRSMIERNSVDAIAAALEAMMARPDSTPLLPEIAVPTLIVCGEEDALTPPADSEALHRAIRGSRLVLLPGAGHLSSLETPMEFSAALAAFLDSPELSGNR